MNTKIQKAFKTKIPSHLDGQRLDLALVEILPQLSRRRIRAIIDVGGCYVDRHRVRIASRKLKAGQIVELENTQPQKPKYSALSQEHILYKHENYIAINKPPGMLSQAARSQAKYHLLSYLKPLLKEGGESNLDLILVHRLDAETPGVILVARNEKYSEYLQSLFKNHSIQKTYHALCYGRLPQKSVLVQNYLTGVHPNTGMVQSTDKQNGKHAETRLNELAYDSQNNISWIEALPKTGRTHQIRVHLASLRCPILGDKKYLQQKLLKIPQEIQTLCTEHHFLHAKSLEWLESPKSPRSIEADYPPNWHKALKFLKFK